MTFFFHVRESHCLGYRVTFDQFITWLVNGNSEADEHWTPAYKLCGVCDVQYKFVGHSEHFNEDIQVKHAHSAFCYFYENRPAEKRIVIERSIKYSSVS